MLGRRSALSGMRQTRRHGVAAVSALEDRRADEGREAFLVPLCP